MAVITVRNLGKEYRLGAQMHDTLRDQITSLLRGGRKRERQQFWALKEVNFDVEQGDVVGIIGRNGAGKSTLLKILSQITEPTEGEIRIRGRIASLLEVGTGFHPELSGRENTYLNGAILGMSRAEITRKFDEIAAFAEMDTFLDTPVKHYSSGMTTRLAFAVAAHLDPEILIIDEVLAVGDAAFQKKCLGRMGEIARGGRTVLFVSHNMAAVTSLCTRGIYLEKGRIKACGPVQEIAETYLHEALPLDLESGCLGGAPRGNGEIRFRSLQVGSHKFDGKVTCGQGLKIKLAYQANSDRVPARFFVNVYDRQQLRIFAFDTQTATDLPQHFPQKGSLVIEIPPALSLTPGVYSLEVSAWVNGVNADHVPGALNFEVQDGDFFGNGRKPSDQSALLFNPTWLVQENDE